MKRRLIIGLIFINLLVFFSILSAYAQTFNTTQFLKCGDFLVRLNDTDFEKDFLRCADGYLAGVNAVTAVNNRYFKDTSKINKHRVLSVVISFCQSNIEQEAFKGLGRLMSQLPEVLLEPK